MSADGEQGFQWPEPKFLPIEGGAKLNPDRVTAAFQLINGELVIGEQLQLIEMLLDGTEYNISPATDTPAVVSDAVLMIIRNVLYRSKMNGCSADVYDTAEEIAAALAKHPTSPEDAA